KYNPLEAALNAPDYNTGSLKLTNPDGQYDLYFNVTNVPLTVEDAADLKVTEFSRTNRLDPLAGESFDYQIVVENVGPGLPRDVVIDDQLRTDSPNFTVNSASYVVVAPDGTASAPAAIPGFSDTGFSLPMGTVAIGSRIVLTMKVMPTRGGV